jgi:hypothetical protein
MSRMNRKSRAAVLMISFGLLVASAAAAGGRSTPQRHALVAARPAEGASLLARLQHLLTGLWAPNGASLDPFGNPQANAVNPSASSPSAETAGDNGASLDPFGGR